MPVIINWKVCDNSKECSAMAVCPTKTITWDEKNKTLKIDNSKCIGCGQCELACPAGAVIVARTDEEIKKIRERIEKDTRKASDLFVDRYGADAVDPSTLVDKSEFGAQILKSDKTAVVEFFSDESIKCLVYSIPIKELFEGKDVKYRKMKVDEKDELLKKYNIAKLPSMAFFKDGKLIGKIEGIFEEKDKGKLKEKIGKIIP